MQKRLTNYFEILGRMAMDTVATDRDGKAFALADAMDWAVR